MELDDLKNKWQQSGEPDTVTSKNKIMELTRQKSQGPVAALRAALGRHALIIPFAIAILLFQALKKPELQGDPFFGLFAAIVVLLAIFFIAAFWIVKKMSRADSPVVDELKRQLRSLQQLLLCYRVAAFVGVVLLAVFLETFQHTGTARLIEGWYEVPLWLRIAAYAGLLVVNFFTSKAFFRREFGGYVEVVKKTLSEAE